MHVITPTAVICAEVSRGSLMHQRLLMSIEWKLKTGINRSRLRYWSLCRHPQRESRDRQRTGLFIGVPADSSRRASHLLSHILSGEATRPAPPVSSARRRRPRKGSADAFARPQRRKCADECVKLARVCDCVRRYGSRRRRVEVVEHLEADGGKKKNSS